MDWLKCAREVPRISFVGPLFNSLQMFAQVLPIITLDEWIGSDAAAAEDGGG
jgi:hypothetical protein